MPIPTIAAKGALAATATGTTQVPALPTGYAVNDILIVYAANNGGQTISISAGWTALGTPASDPDFAASIWWRRAATTSETAPTITHSGSASTTIGHYAKTWAVRGAITSATPFEEVVDQTALVTANNAPKWGGLTTQGIDRLVCAVLLVDANTAMSAAVRTGFTEQENIGSTTGGDFYIYAISKGEAAAGAVYTALEAYVGGTGLMNAAAFYRSTSFAVIGAAAVAAAVPSWGFVPMR